MSPAQRRALECLAAGYWRTPADLGYAVSTRTRPIKAQGAGRVGGAMGARLIALGWAVSAAHLRGGFPAYAITEAGRRALKGEA